MLDPRWHATKEGKLSDLKISCNNRSNFEDGEIKKRSSKRSERKGRDSNMVPLRLSILQQRCSTEEVRSVIL